MISKLLTSIFGSSNDRTLKRLRKRVAQINKLEPTFEQLSDEALKDKTAEFKQRLADGVSLDSLLPGNFCDSERSKQTSIRYATI